MLIYYVNLAKRNDRRQAMEARLAKLGLTAERVEAVSPSDIDPCEIKKYCNPAKHLYMAPAELCCSLSHIAAMRRFLSTSAEFCLILEDDALLSCRLPTFLAHFEVTKPDVDVLRLETDRRPMRLSIDTQFEIAGVGAHRLYSGCAGAAGYVISKKAAATLVDSDEMRVRQTDEAMFNPYRPLARQLKILQATPALIIQEHHVRAKGSVSQSNIALARVRRNAIDSGNSPTRLWFRFVDFLDRDFRIAALKHWHQLVRKSSKRAIPFADHGSTTT